MLEQAFESEDIENGQSHIREKDMNLQVKQFFCFARHFRDEEISELGEHMVEWLRHLLDFFMLVDIGYVVVCTFIGGLQMTCKTLRHCTYQEQMSLICCHVLSPRLIR